MKRFTTGDTVIGWNNNQESTYIYDGKRLVGVMPYDSTQVFDKIMLADNL